MIKTTTEGGKQLPWFAIDREHIQGVVFCHHYEAWILTWNVSREGLLAKYWLPPKGFDKEKSVSPKVVLASLDDLFNSPPTEMRGEFSESEIHIHCPWRRSDAAAACDVVQLLSRHCDNLEAQDDMGVWPNKDFTKWVNFANKYSQALGGKPLHPDITDDLRSG